MTRDLFWFAAGMMVALAGLVVAIPLWRVRRDAANPRPRAGLWIGAAVLLGVAAATIALYAWLGTPSAIGTTGQDVSGAGQAPQSAAQEPAPAVTAPSMEDATARLAARLATSGGSRSDWELLAQSYDFLGRPAEAAAARDRAATSGAAAVTPFPATGPPAAATPSNVARIAGTVDLEANVRDRAAAGATLFIYAREPGASGPPLAVLRVSTDRWPVSFTLDDSNSMIPGRDLSHAGIVQVEARISRSGNATPQSGDLVGTTASVDPRSDKPIRVAIDRVL